MSPASTSSSGGWELAVDYITGPLIGESAPRGQAAARASGRCLNARLMKEWRIRYEIDADKYEVLVIDIQHRADAYRRR